MFSNERWKEKDMQETACLDWKGKGSVLVRILCGFHLKLFQQDTQMSVMLHNADGGSIGMPFAILFGLTVQQFGYHIGELLPGYIVLEIHVNGGNIAVIIIGNGKDDVLPIGNAVIFPLGQDAISIVLLVIAFSQQLGDTVVRCAHQGEQHVQVHGVIFLYGECSGSAGGRIGFRIIFFLSAAGQQTGEQDSRQNKTKELFHKNNLHSVADADSTEGVCMIRRL